MSIKSKLITTSALMVFCAVLFVATPLIVRQVRVQQSDIQGDAAYMQQIVYSEVEKFLAEPKAMLDAMVDYARTQELDREVITPFLAGIASRNSDFQYVYYVASVPYKDGGFLADNLHLDIPADYDQTTRGWFKAAAQSSGYIVTEPYMDIMVGGVVITIAERVYENGEFLGVAAIDIALDKIVAFASNFAMTQGGASYILSKDGLYITNSDSNKVLKANFFTENGFTQYRSAVSGRGGFVSLNAGGGRYLLGSALPDVTGWLFVSTGRTSELYGAISASVRFAVLIALLCIAAALVVTVVTANHIVKPITEVVGAVKGIAEGNADLTYRLSVTSHDEIGNLVENFNAFMEKLQAIIRVMKQSKSLLTKAGGEFLESTKTTETRVDAMLGDMRTMSGSIETQAQSVQQTADAVNEILTSIDALESMVRSQAGGVTQASSAVEQMISNISSVNASVDKMAEAFRSLDEDAESGAQTQQELGAQIARIEAQSKLLQDANTTIASIASQTNLLAMNAAIEAAHAGAAGQGFAVVADEIRKLSETSSAQSKTIGAQLKDIQRSISTVVTAAQDGVKGYTVLSDEIRETDKLVRQIKTAMEEQNEGSKQIIGTLRSMNDDTTSVKRASADMADGSRAILREVQALQSATATMKQGMRDLSAGADGISETSAALAAISRRMESSISDIGSQVDQFEV